MYQPNFCNECGEQVIRERWHLWTSRRFCAKCAPRFRKQHLLAPILAGGSLLGAGLAAGHLTNPAPSPLTVEQRPAPLMSAPPPAASQQAALSPNPATIGVVSMCGARTKKGAPCSRRVHGTGRCFQHIGLPAILPPERLILQR